MYCDAHTHLNSDELFPEWQNNLQNFIDQGGKALVNVGVDTVWNERGIIIAQESEQYFGDQCRVKATVGYHPSEVSYGHVMHEDDIIERMKLLKNMIQENKTHIVAIGEGGIDAHYPGRGDQHLRLQQTLFHAQLQCARDFQLPVVIHSRDAYAQTKEVLEEFRDCNIYMHCRGYDAPQMSDMIDSFPHLRCGFCGNVTYPKAIQLRESLEALVHHDRFQNGTVGLLLETDAPWLAHQGKRGQRNEPAFIVGLYAAIAEMIHWDNDKLSDRVQSDFKMLYGA